MNEVRNGQVTYEQTTFWGKNVLQHIWSRIYAIWLYLLLFKTDQSGKSSFQLHLIHTPD